MVRIAAGCISYYLTLYQSTFWICLANNSITKSWDSLSNAFTVAPQKPWWPSSSMQAFSVTKVPTQGSADVCTGLLKLQIASYILLMTFCSKPRARLQPGEASLIAIPLPSSEHVWYGSSFSSIMETWWTVSRVPDTTIGMEPPPDFTSAPKDNGFSRNKSNL